MTLEELITQLRKDNWNGSSLVSKRKDLSYGWTRERNLTILLVSY